MRVVRLIVVAGLVAGCATTAARAPIDQAPVDIAGRWTGTWLGHGAFLVPRDQPVTLDLVHGEPVGTGRLVMEGALGADPVPDTLRDAGMAGVRIVFDVSGPRVRLRHELGGELFEAELVVAGDRMVGHVLHTAPIVRFDLTRAKAEVASAPLTTTPPTAPASPPPPVAERPRAAAPPVEPPAPPPPPRRQAPPPAEFRASPEVRTIHFDFDRADVRPDDVAILDASAEWLRANPDRLVLIEGHCDERGTAEYNVALGERRALSAKAYLIGRGVADSRLTVTTYGFERPLCTEHAESCWSQNRRAAFLVKPREVITPPAAPAARPWGRRGSR